MHSYIEIYQFTPQVSYKPIEALTPFIEQTMSDQNVEDLIGTDKLLAFKENIIKCMEVYYKLVGINEEVIAGKGMVEPKGVLPRYTESLIKYFQNLQQYVPGNKEIIVLEYSGVSTIKIRYKYTDSVIKKLVKLGLRDPKIFENPLSIFLKCGALHDLVGMLFICSSPYEKMWVARSLYNFFEFNYRTDDHLIYGFYTVQRKSGYRGLHCDHTLFNPRFDASFSEELEQVPYDSEELFSLLKDEDDEVTVLHKLKKYFNVEIQLHTTFENLWSAMEHRSSYNVHAKGKGRNAEITAQWKFLSDNMKNLEMQFERLQIDTEQAHFKEPLREGYAFIKTVFETFDTEGGKAYTKHKEMIKKIEDLEELFATHEISRQDYVQQILSEAERIDSFAQQQTDPSIQVVFKLASAFTYYGLANHRQFFNEYDIQQFVQKSLKQYKDIYTFIASHDHIYKGNMITVIAILRYLHLAQLYGYGLVDLKDVTFTYSTTPAVPYEESLSYFETVLSLFNQLNEEDLDTLRSDNSAYIRVIHQLDSLAQEWELLNAEDEAEQSVKTVKEIEKFRKKFINVSLLDQLETLLETDKITNVGFVVRFYSLLVWHSIYPPLDALKKIIKYSAYDKIKTSDILYYELASYKFLVQNRCEEMSDCQHDPKLKDHETEKIRHYQNYHRNNMIQQLFRIYRDEPIFNFHKARVHFEKLTQTTFKINHFSDTIEDCNIK